MKIPFLGKKKKKDRITLIFINELGKLEMVDALPEDKKITHDNKSYVLDKNARLIDSENRPAFIYMKGVPVPLNFNGVKKPGDIKLDAGPLKAVLGAKLFGDLFSADRPKPWDIIMDVMLIVNMILNVLILLQVTGVIDRVMNNA